jgi:hypothetical protein
MAYDTENAGPADAEKVKEEVKAKLAKVESQPAKGSKNGSKK